MYMVRELELVYVCVEMLKWPSINMERYVAYEGLECLWMQTSMREFGSVHFIYLGRVGCVYFR